MLIGFIQKLTFIVSQLGLVCYKQMLIHWDIRRWLNNNYSSNGLLGMKQQRMETGFL